MIPGGLPVAEAFDVFDRDEGLRRVAEDLSDEPILALNLCLLVGGVVEDLAVEVAKNIVADLAHDLEMSRGEHRRQHALHQGLAGLAVATGVAGVAEPRELVEARRKRP